MLEKVISTSFSVLHEALQPLPEAGKLELHFCCNKQGQQIRIFTAEVSLQYYTGINKQKFACA